MKKATNILKILSGVALASALAGCGGGGGGGSTDTSSGSFQVTLKTATALTMNAGESVQVPGVANSFPEPIASVSWTASATNGAPALSLTNADCADAGKKSQSTATAGKVTAEWTCAAGVTASASINADATYDLTMTATDTSGNSATSITHVTVKPATGPSAAASIPTTATAGENVTATCTGSNGFALSPGMYTYQWVSTPTLPLSTATSSTTTFVAPVASTPKNYLVTCRVTDDNNKTTTASGTITVSPPPAPTIVPSVVKGRVATSSEVVDLDGSATSWIDAFGNAFASTIYYNWSQTAGPTVTIYNGATAQATAALPPSVASKTSFGFTLKASNQPFVSGVSSGTVASSADVFYIMDANPPLALSTTFSDSVDSGSFVVIPVTATATPATALPLYYGWTQVSGTSVVLGGATTNTLNFGAPVNGTANPIILVFRVSAGYEPITVANPGSALLDVVVVVDPPVAP